MAVIDIFNTQKNITSSMQTRRGRIDKNKSISNIMTKVRNTKMT